MRALAVFLSLLLALPSFAQQPRTATSQAKEIFTVEMEHLTSATSTRWFDITSYGVTEHALSIVFVTRPTAVNVALECSKDYGTTVDTTLASSSSISSDTIKGSGTCTHIRATITSVTGTVRMAALYRGSVSTNLPTGPSFAEDSLPVTFAHDIPPLPVRQSGVWTVEAILRDMLGNPVKAGGWGLRVELPPSQNPCTGIIPDDQSISTAADAVIIAGQPGMATVICGGRIVADAAEDVSELEGSGTVCGTGTLAHAGSTTHTDGQALAANGGYVIVGPYKLLPGNDWCIALGTTNGVRGQVLFTRVPTN